MSCPPSRTRGIGNPQSAIRNPQSQKGVALIITIILLGVVTFMAIAFLALSRRERGAVTTVTDTAGARLAADAALASAEAQIVANALNTTNPYNFGLLVSTNYINYAGFQRGLYSSSFTNVNYFYSDGTPLNTADFLQNLTNLWYSPRPPVFIATNSAGSNDFRFYLDLNRNGQFDANGWVNNVDNNGKNILDGSGNAVTTFQVGDPEWIGILQRPDQPYGPNNPFVARYAFIAIPVGNTLDLNAIHNQVFDENNGGNGQVNPPFIGDNYFRNEGVGSWEINLAAFLADLNTNQWLPTMPPNATYYAYNQPLNAANTGHAFEDACALLAWRYNNNYYSLASVDNLYGGPLYGPGYTSFINDNIDGYSDGPLQTGLSLPGDIANPPNDDPSKPWAGADNTNRFFTHQELFDTGKTAMNMSAAQLAAGNDFSQRLLNAGTNQWGGTTVATYDRYTFYRLLAQLGTDSSPDSGKMNLNYDNLDPFVTNTLTYPPASTNFMPWTPLGFFTNAADRMLRAYTTQWRNSNPTNFAAEFYAATGFTNLIASQWTNNYLSFGITNIPVLMSNQFVYSPAVNRLLQLAANLYDASTNSFYPSVFRPTFWVTNEYGYKNVYINGYQQVVLSNAVPANDIQLSAPIDIAALANGLAGSTANNDPYGINVYGVPWIIGVKKGLPSFNQLYMVNAMEITRKLEVTRASAALPLDFTKYATNQMYVMSITNNIGISFWNSYSNYYPGSLTVYASDWIQMTMTNWVQTWSNNVNFPLPAIATNLWPGSGWGANTILPPNEIPNPSSFYFTNWSYTFVPEAAYSVISGALTAYTTNLLWESNAPLWGLDHWGPLALATTNRLQAFILDGNHVIDYVQLRGPLDFTNLNQALANPDYPDPTQKYYQWSTNLYQPPGPLTYGVYHQIEVSMNPTYANGLGSGNTWVPPPGMPTSIGTSTAAQSQFFNGFFAPYYKFNGQTYTNSQLSIQVPYTPSRMVYDYVLWQANDPLVHYLGSDLNYQSPGVTGWQQSDTLTTPPITQNSPGIHYQPWGTNKMANIDTNGYNITYKDPLIWCPDNWDFPMNKYPTVGWLGRVHRGTPWQTVYLKASGVDTNTWVNWTGDVNLYDAINMAPGKDRLLFDLFTTAFNDNATRGTLSVNQDHLAAWSALFSGMVALSNSTAHPRASYTVRPTTTWTNINPAGGSAAASLLWQIVTNINTVRGNTNLFPLGSFTHVGDILSAPVLTEKSPFLNTNIVTPKASEQLKHGISDELYEWLPQQMMSLLRCSSSPRYVIYCYGQTLKPAPDSVYNSGGPFFGMITNYQVVSEIATRAVVRFNSTVTNVITTDGTNWFSQPVPINNNAVIESFNLLPPD